MPSMRDYGVGGFGGLQQLPDLNKPVIAAVNGICCRRRVRDRASCDLILAAEHATFALPESGPAQSPTPRRSNCRKRIPYHVAMDLLLTGRWIDAVEARQWGLVNRIVAADQLIDEAWTLARCSKTGRPGVRRDQGNRPRGGGSEIPNDAGARD